MWSWSSCEMKTHRTSTGSTIENVLSSHSSRTSEQPVSTMTGSLAADHERVGTEERSRRLGGEASG